MATRSKLHQLKGMCRLAVAPVGSTRLTKSDLALVLDGEQPLDTDWAIMSYSKGGGAVTYEEQVFDFTSDEAGFVIDDETTAKNASIGLNAMEYTEDVLPFVFGGATVDSAGIDFHEIDVENGDTRGEFSAILVGRRIDGKMVAFYSPRTKPNGSANLTLVPGQQAVPMVTFKVLDPGTSAVKPLTIMVEKTVEP